MVFATQRERGTPFDPRVEGVKVSLRYRVDNNDGNPARTFRVVGMASCTKSEMAQYRRLRPPSDVVRNQRNEDDAWRRTYRDHYLGALTMLFEAEEVKCFIDRPLLRFEPQEEIFRASVADQWFPTLQWGMDIGFVWQPSPRGDGLADMVPGEMRKDGRVWKWQALTEETDVLEKSNAMAQFNRIQVEQTLDAYVNSLLYTLECRLILAVIALRNSGSTYLKT